MPLISDLQITRTINGRIVELHQINPACIAVMYQITGDWSISEVTAAETIYFSEEKGGKRFAYIARVGEHFFADLSYAQSNALEISSLARCA